jgi:hypothetical protein
MLKKFNANVSIIMFTLSELLATFFNKMIKAFPQWLELIDKSFLSDSFKLQYKEIINERIARIK